MEQACSKSPLQIFVERMLCRLENFKGTVSTDMGTLEWMQHLVLKEYCDFINEALEVYECPTSDLPGSTKQPS